MHRVFFIFALFAALLGYGEVSADSEGGKQKIKDDAQAGPAVYDANGQYIGVSTGPSTIYVPSVKKYLVIDFVTGDVSTAAPGQPNAARRVFMTTDCTGTIYSDLPAINSVFRINDAYFTADPSTPPTELSMGSFYSDTYGCENRFHYPYMLVQLVKVDLPFKTPVALPYVYK